MLRHIVEAGLLFAVVFATAHTERSTYGIPETCTCGFQTLPRGKRCRAISDNECYPDHRDLGISADCLPDIEDNTRVCFRTRVKECTNDRGGVDYHCRFFYKNFTNEPLPKSCESAVFLSPPTDADYKTFCLFRVNLGSSANCTSIRLQHMVDYQEEEYVDSLNVSHPCRDSSETNPSPACQDYLQIYYGTQTRVLCRRELAEFELRLVNVTSFVAVYWSDSTTDPNTTSDFNIRAECDV